MKPYKDIHLSHTKGNRFARIHVLFRLLAQEKLGKEAPKLEINEFAKKVKTYWKDFYSIETLKNLPDSELLEVERLVENRIKVIHELKVK